ncbi:MAG: hypothetical protein GX491_18480 [Chloroflexi bacterium]|nr:hypothetical protein [Chloroflexota bacterium]
MNSSSNRTSQISTPLNAPQVYRHALIGVIFGACAGAGIAWLSQGEFWPGWLAFSLLAAASLFVLLRVWARMGSEKILLWMVLLAFGLRLISGIGLSQALPVWGYAEPEQQAGYLFKDAYQRDLQAWELAQSGRPLWDTFRSEFVSDQYGGLLALSASVYRFLSPDAHRPYLILILGSFFAALGLPFLYQAARMRWSARIAGIAGWIYVFYPDAIFFASGQMREPFIVGLGAVAFWAVLAWGERKRPAAAALFFSLLGMALISNRVAAAVVGILGLLFLLEYIIVLPDRRWKILGWLGLAVGVLLLVVFSWEWFKSSTRWDLKVTGMDSGWVAKIIDEASERTGLPSELVGPAITVTYGLARPVLPAAVAEDAQSVLWKTIGIFRSAGWYALAPFLVYSLFAIFREPDPARRRRAIWLALVVFLWLVIASARGGGDATDNPRYRSLFIPWMALLAGWSIDWALSHRDPWLWRWIAVEVIFVGFFTNWYFSRYFHLWQRLQFWQMALWIVGLSGFVLVGGWVWDRFRAGKPGVSQPDRIDHQERNSLRTK